MKTSLLYEKPVDPANWVGLVKFPFLLPNLRVRRQTMQGYHHIHKPSGIHSHLFVSWYLLDAVLLGILSVNEFTL